MAFADSKVKKKWINLRVSTANLKREIQRYLVEHPNAGDNREGILRFWLSEKARQECHLGINQALASLVEDGWLKEKHMPNGDIIYISTAKVKRLAPKNAKGRKS